MSIKIKKRDDLKAAFKAGEIPLEEDFHSLIDATLLSSSDGIRTSIQTDLVDAGGNSDNPELPNSTIEIRANERDASSARELLNFYENFDAGSTAKWKLRLHDETSNGDTTPATISLSDSSGKGMFLQEGTGNLGLGTNNPTEKLTIMDGGLLFLNSTNNHKKRLTFDSSENSLKWMSTNGSGNEETQMELTHDGKLRLGTIDDLEGKVNGLERLIGGAATEGEASLTGSITSLLGSVSELEEKVGTETLSETGTLITQVNGLQGKVGTEDLSETGTLIAQVNGLQDKVGTEDLSEDGTLIAQVNGLQGSVTGLAGKIGTEDLEGEKSLILHVNNLQTSVSGLETRIGASDAAEEGSLMAKIKALEEKIKTLEGRISSQQKPT